MSEIHRRTLFLLQSVLVSEIWVGVFAKFRMFCPLFTFCLIFLLGDWGVFNATTSAGCFCVVPGAVAQCAAS